ncbi:hypothetical protein PHAVU_002G163800 [Phaseolus vulgaris]|uniref:Uncharacterized protein n=1 Tax=Phaseolus vulgaris TaxID=3885 RepID=V7CK44_PHAVU|nr:hypothetical protein PHAVU_002G163800g [Phaseolus vulgaris]ESW30567.1 hypothetical protein PHAVU_002G163800g [Phaseolus vulgaris]
MRRRGNWVNGRVEKRKRTRGDDDEKETVDVHENSTWCDVKCVVGLCLRPPEGMEMYINIQKLFSNY